MEEDSGKGGFCSICLEHLKEAVSTDCGHLFCQECLARHLKDGASETSCPVCRTPCSEKVLGEGYVCQRHQKLVSLFCEEHCLLLCEKCQESPEHQSHQHLAIEKARSHYKERLGRRIRKLKKLKTEEEKKLQISQFRVDYGDYRLEAEMKSQHQARNALLQQQQDQLEDLQAQKTRILNISKAITELSNFITPLEKAEKQLEPSILKNIRDLLNRSVP